MTTTLYEITNDLAQAQRDLSAMLSDGVISEAEYDDTLAATLEQHKVKTVGVIAHIKNLEGEAALYKLEIEKLQKRLKSTSSSLSFYKQYLLDQLTKAGQSEAGGGVHTCKIKKGVKRCEITDLDALDMDYKIVESSVRADKRAITQAIKAGETIEGAALVAGPDTLKIN